MAIGTHQTLRLAATRPGARVKALAILITLLVLPVAHAADPGTIVGIVTDAAHTPVPQATVTAVHAGDHAIRATVTHADGLYTFADLPPGTWALSWEAPGYAATSLAALEVTSGKATRRDVVMNAIGGAASSSAPALAAVVVPPAAAPAAAPAPAKPAPTVPVALQAPDPGPAVDTQTPFAVGYLGWMNGTSQIGRAHV